MIGSIESQLFGWSILLFGPVLCRLLAKRDDALFLILLGGWAARAALAVTHNYVIHLPDSQFDALNFQTWAFDGAQGGLQGAIHHFRTGAYFYASIWSFLFLILGPSQLLMQSINVVFGLVIIKLVYLLARLVWCQSRGRVAALLAAFWPSLILYSAITMREVFVVLFLLASAYFSILWVRERKSVSGITALSAMFIALMFHTAAAVGILVAGMILFAVIIRAYIRLPVSLYFVRLLPIVAVIVTIGGVVIGTGIGLEKIRGNLLSIGLDVLASQQENVSVSRARYLEGMVVTSWTDLVTHAPIRMAYFLFSPFPWQVRAPVDVIGAMDGFLYFVGVLGIILAIFKVKRRTEFLIIFLFLASFIYVFSFVTSNSGSALRHRGKLAPMAIVLAAGATIERKSSTEVQHHTRAISA